MQGEVHVHDLARDQEAPDQPPSPRGAKEVGAKVDAQQTMGCLVCSYKPTFIRASRVSRVRVLISIRV